MQSPQSIVFMFRDILCLYFDKCQRDEAELYQNVSASSTTSSLHLLQNLLILAKCGSLPTSTHLTYLRINTSKIITKSRKIWILAKIDAKLFANCAPEWMTSVECSYYFR